MSGIQYGDCSPDVTALQKLLNKQFGYKVKTTGEMDDATAQAVDDLKAKIGINNSSADVSAATLSAIQNAALPRTKVVIKGKEAWVTKEELIALRAKAGSRAGDAVRAYTSMAGEAKLLWDAHDKARTSNWFWSKAVDVATGAKFPPKSVITAAVSAAKSMESDARACKLDPKSLSSRSKPIRTAFAAMDQYRDETFGGGAELVSNLELIRDGCEVTLQVAAAVATAGASWKVQVGVSAGVAAYGQVLKEADTASKTASYNVGTGISNVFMAAVVDGTVGLLMKGGKLGPFMDKVADEAVKQAGSKLLKAYAIKAVNGGAQQMIEDGIKGLTGLADPKKSYTFDDFVKAAAESFVKGAGLKILGPVCEKYGKGAGKLFKLEDFKGLGKIEGLDKSGEALIQQAIDKIAPAAITQTLNTFTVRSPAKSFEPALRKKILANPQIKRAIAQAAKQKK